MRPPFTAFGIKKELGQRWSHLFSRRQGKRARREMAIYLGATLAICALIYFFTRPSQQ
jgi:hypothetical protein